LDVKTTLEQVGVSTGVLPKRFGGDLDDASFQNWIKMRLKIEQPMLTTSTSSTKQYTTRGSTSLLVKRKQSADEASDESSEKDFVRKRNALYARRMYYKKKLDLIALPEQKKALERQNDVLRRENHRLIMLLNEARRVVASSQPDCQPFPLEEDGKLPPSHSFDIYRIFTRGCETKPIQMSNDAPSRHECEEESTSQLERIDMDSSRLFFENAFDIGPHTRNSHGGTR
jgi:hypothetical protein